MKIDGRCHCGYITYEADADPALAAICHCTDCQTFSGAAFRGNVPVQAEKFHMTGGEPTFYVKTAESGNKRKQAFCPRCGTSIYATSVEDHPKVFGLRLGAIKQRDQFVPKTQIWTRSAQPWVNTLASLPKIETQGPMTAPAAPAR
jgi:hypothetical protein